MDFRNYLLIVLWICYTFNPDAYYLYGETKAEEYQGLLFDDRYLDLGGITFIAIVIVFVIINIDQ